MEQNKEVTWLMTKLPYMFLFLRTVTNESAEPQKTAADQVDCGQTRSQAKTFFDQQGD